jgi:hypothetical protein
MLALAVDQVMFLMKIIFGDHSTLPGEDNLWGSWQCSITHIILVLPTPWMIKPGSQVFSWEIVSGDLANVSGEDWSLKSFWC